MAIENTVTCDQCNKQHPAEAVRADRSRWMRVVPYSSTSGGIIGRVSPTKKDFCSAGCLSAFCAEHIPPKEGE